MNIDSVQGSDFWEKNNKQGDPTNIPAHRKLLHHSTEAVNPQCPSLKSQSSEFKKRRE